MVGEYEGAVHLVGKQRAKDVRREAEFRGVGLEYVTMLGADFADPSGFAARLRQAYERAARRPAGACRWTVEPPGWWIPTVTVEQRRALDERTRERLLRHRRAA